MLELFKTISIIFGFFYLIWVILFTIPIIEDGYEKGDLPYILIPTLIYVVILGLSYLPYHIQSNKELDSFDRLGFYGIEYVEYHYRTNDDFVKTRSTVRSKKNDIREHYGDVYPNSVAYKLNLKPKDLISNINGNKIKNIHDYYHIINNINEGDTISIGFIRDNEDYQVSTILKSINNHKHKDHEECI